MNRKYPTNREFVKTLRHNGKNYTLRSIFDTDNQFDFDKTIAKYNKSENRFYFDMSIQQKQFQQLNIDDIFNTSYNYNDDILF